MINAPNKFDIKDTKLFQFEKIFLISTQMNEFAQDGH